MPTSEDIKCRMKPQGGSIPKIRGFGRWSSQLQPHIMGMSSVNIGFTHLESTWQIWLWTQDLVRSQEGGEGGLLRLFLKNGRDFTATIEIRSFPNGRVGVRVLLYSRRDIHRSKPPSQTNRKFIAVLYQAHISDPLVSETHPLHNNVNQQKHMIFM